LRQLLADPLAGDVRAAKCFALDAAEARAEKVRAAFTREAVRDFYDLDRLNESGADLSSSSFIKLVDEKLAELRAVPMAKQGKSFGLTEKRRRQVNAGLARDLPAVLRTDAREFDLDGMLARFDRLWRK
jgi:predicted nucleotidyltransferase component of viral defense system